MFVLAATCLVTEALATLNSKVMTTTSLHGSRRHAYLLKPTVWEWIIGYFMKIAPKLTHLTNFCKHLATQLMMIDLDAETAVTLAPHLKTEQLKVMTNGDNYILILPNFELYKTWISHSCAPSQVTTNVIGVKGSPKDTKLLSKVFIRLASDTSTDQQDGVYLPKGTVHLLGMATFKQVLKENNFFLNTVVTIPVNMEFDAWFAVIDPNNMSDMTLISLHDHLL